MRAEGRFSPAFMGQGFSAKRAIFRVVEKRRGMTGIDHPAIQLRLSSRAVAMGAQARETEPA